MPFHLLPLQKEDCEAFAIVDEAASRHWPLARAMEQGAASRRDMFAEWFHGTWGTDPGMKWMKVVDSETGEMVAGALWKFVLEPMPSPPDKGSKVEEIEGKGGPKQQAGDEDAIPPVFMEMGRRWKEFKDEFIGDQPFASNPSLGSTSYSFYHALTLTQQTSKSSSPTLNTNAAAPRACSSSTAAISRTKRASRVR